MIEGECEVCHQPLDTTEYKEPCDAADRHKPGEVGCVLCNHTGMMTIKDTLCEDCMTKLFGDD